MKKLKSLILVTITLSAFYSGAWFFMGYKINQSVDHFYTENKNISFYGEKPVLSGFPFAPVMTYHKGFTTKNMKMNFSEITVKGFPIPTWPLTVNINKPLTLTATQTHKSLKLDHLKAVITIPKSFPKSTKKNDVSAWQKTVGHINVKSFKTAKAGMKIFAKGHIGLDDNLQPILDLNSTITDHAKLVQFFVETGELKPLPAALALSALNAMVQTTPKTNEDYVDITLKIQDRVLFLGPIRTIKLPPIYWR